MATEIKILNESVFVTYPMLFLSSWFIKIDITNGWRHK